MAQNPKPDLGFCGTWALEGHPKGAPAKEAEMPRKEHGEEQIVFALKRVENWEGPLPPGERRTSF